MATKRKVRAARVEAEPAVDPLEGRPHGPKHLNCPLYQQPMSRVCRACGWWQGRPVNVGTKAEPKFEMHFKCDQGRTADQITRLIADTDGYHIAANEQRNAEFKVKAAMVAALGAIGRDLAGFREHLGTVQAQMVQLAGRAVIERGLLPKPKPADDAGGSDSGEPV